MRRAFLFFCLLALSGDAFAQLYNGNWSGTTGQGKTLTFTVANNAMTTISFGGTATAVGCTTNFTQTTASRHRAR